MSASVVVIGDVLIDELVDEAGSISVPGGSALNVAVGLAILGVRVSLVGMIGDDNEAGVIRRLLSDHGVELRATVGTRGTGRAISDRRNGEPRYHFNEAVRARAIDFDDAITQAIRDADQVAISGFPFDAIDQVEQLVEVLAPARGYISIDPNPRSDLIRDLGEYRANLEMLADRAQLLKIGDEDAELLYSCPVEDVTARFRKASTIAVLGTSGGDGAFISTPAGRVARSIKFDPRPIVDTMGAGDATFAVVIAALQNSHPASTAEWEVVLDRAMSAAAETIRFPGALLRLGSDSSSEVGSRTAV